MKLLYAQEHLTCFNYDKGERPGIEKFTLTKGQYWNIFPIDNKAIFLIKGALRFSLGETTDMILPEGKIMLLPVGSRFTSIVEEDVTFMVMRLQNTKQLCDCFTLDLLLRKKQPEMNYNGLYFLDINKRVEPFLDFLDTCMTDGLKCRYYFELKSKEFYFLLRAYYSKTELLKFFYPLLSGDISFSEMVIKNHYKVRTVQELAQITNYSLSGFQKRFKKVFGTSAYHWMKEERSKSIYHEINSTGKSFKVISEEYGFSSPSHFNDFCKVSFGVTPGKIRSKKTI